MKCKISSLLLALSSSSLMHGQDKSGQMALRPLFQTADSIVILSHQDLNLRATKEEMKQGIGGYNRHIVDDAYQLNECIVVERAALDQQATITLKEILMRQKRDDEVPADKASCFLPHETILFYRQGICAYIDICFGCRRYELSTGIHLEAELLQASSDWTLLEAFFIRHQVSYEIDIR
ncbi:hypothetical protein [Taibaiella koreensis]|uniref:hypothetical protein n=1 Tax=Taibaiella koreensis TaxID=1268548 RepID=UPI0013C2E51C|nr:hypothetical protein [Taibaiella koreensis]